jgi:hypothetical protein
MTDQEIIAAALAAGWRYDCALLYDEEGVEGFCWTGPNGEELISHVAGGAWANGPEVPDELRAEDRPATKAAETARLAELLRRRLP